MADLRQMSFLLGESFQSGLESLEITDFQHCLKTISVFRVALQPCCSDFYASVVQLGKAANDADGGAYTEINCSS